MSDRAAEATVISLAAAMAEGRLRGPAWGGMPAVLFFQSRVLPDIVKSYYAHPTAWSEIGFGGPASPRGYVRLDFNARDPWEAAEAALSTVVAIKCYQ